LRIVLTINFLLVFLTDRMPKKLNMRLAERLTTFALITILFLALTSISEGAEFKIVPSITLSEEYNDNIFLVKEGKEEDYITRVRPSITLEYKMPRWESNVEYGFDYRYYAKKTRNDRVAHTLYSETNIEIIKKVFFLNLEDIYKRVSLNVTRDFTAESIFVNQTDQNIFNLNPYFVLRPASLLTVTTGYIFSDIWNRRDEAIDRIYNIAYIDSAFEVSPRVTLNARYEYSQVDTDAIDYNQNDISFGPRYNYAEGSYLFFMVGNTWLDFEGPDSFSNILWDAGITHKLATFTALLSSTRSYIVNPTSALTRKEQYKISISRTSERVSFDISIFYREFIRDAVNEGRKTTSYGISGDILYALTPKMTGTFGFNITKFQEEIANTYTNRYIPTLGIKYLLLEDLNLNFEYKYIDSFSPKLEGNNYKKNRLILSLRKSF